MLPANLRPKLLPMLAGFGFYLLTTGVSYAAFNYLRTPPDIQYSTPVPEGGGLAIDPNEPKTEACPLNGELFTKTESRVWETRRPLAVMIENHTEARPQSGVSSADVVYEAVAEGGITRFLALFYCDAIDRDTTVGPVRSARTYYLDWASEYGENPLYVHVGGANVPGPANALGQIQEYGWGGRNGNDLNQFSIGFPTFWRDYERLGRTVATEHTMYSTTEKLWAEGKKRGWTNEEPETKIDWQEHFVPWSFTEDPTEGVQADSVSFGFWEGFDEYKVVWQYDQSSGVYQRQNGGSPAKDLNNDRQITAKVVIIEFLNEKGPIDELKHLLYTTSGTGTALVFQNGQVIEAAWSKKNRMARTVFSAKAGKEISLSPGKVWVEVIPTGNSVDY